MKKNLDASKPPEHPLTNPGGKLPQRLLGVNVSTKHRMYGQKLFMTFLIGFSDGVVAYHRIGSTV